jgi:hypothetical protein
MHTCVGSGARAFFCVPFRPLSLPPCVPFPLFSFSPSRVLPPFSNMGERSAMPTHLTRLGCAVQLPGTALFPCGFAFKSTPTEQQRKALSPLNLRLGIILFNIRTFSGPPQLGRSFISVGAGCKAPKIQTPQVLGQSTEDWRSRCRMQARHSLESMQPR